MVRARERQLEVLKLRKQGKTYQEIANEVGISKTMAYKIVFKYLERLQREGVMEVDALRAQSANRLHSLLEAVWERALSGDLAAVEQAAKLQDRLDKLYGVHAPVKSEVVSRVENLSPDELKAEAAKLGIYQPPPEPQPAA
jgi:transposase